MIPGIKVSKNDFIGIAVWYIIYVLSFFIFYYLDLFCQRFFCNRVDHITQAIRINPEYLFKSILWNDFIINSTVTPGAAVTVTAPIRYQLTVSSTRGIFRVVE